MLAVANTISFFILMASSRKLQEILSTVETAWSLSLSLSLSLFLSRLPSLMSRACRRRFSCEQNDHFKLKLLIDLSLTAEVKNVWSCRYTPQYAPTAWTGRFPHVLRI